MTVVMRHDAVSLARMSTMPERRARSSSICGRGYGALTDSIGPRFVARLQVALECLGVDVRDPEVSEAG